MKNLLIFLLSIAIACNKQQKNETTVVTANSFNEKVEQPTIINALKEETDFFYVREYEWWE